MEKLAFYLGRFENWLPEDQKVKRVVIEVVSREVGIELTTSEISLRDGKIYLKLPPAAKSQIFIYRRQLRECLRERLAEVHPRQIV